MSVPDDAGPADAGTPPTTARYFIQVTTSSLCLQADLHEAPCVAPTAQFDLSGPDAGATLQLVGTSTCVTAANGDLNGLLSLATCAGTPAQQFAPTSLDGGHVRFENLGSQLCLEFDPAQPTRGLEQWTCGDYANQSFTLLTALPAPAMGCPADSELLAAMPDGGRTVDVGTVAGFITALGSAQPGDVIRLAPGTYALPADPSAATVVGVTGTAELPVFVTSADPGHKAVIDGSNVTVSSVYDCGWSLGDLQYVVLDDLELTNTSSTALCIAGENSHHVWFQNNDVHDTMSRAIGITGDDIYVIDNLFERTVLMNYHANPMYLNGWASSVSTWGFTDPARRNTNIVMVGNTVRDSWGEGLNFLKVSGGLARHNVIENAWSSHIYADHSTQLVIDRNVMMITSDEFSPDTPYPGNHPASAIGLLQEDYLAETGTVPQPMENIVVTNNLAWGTWHGINRFQTSSTATDVPGNTWNNVTIAGNVFWNLRGPNVAAIDWAPKRPNAAAPSGGIFSGNVIGPTAYPINLGDPSAWTSADNASGPTPGFTGDPSMTDPMNFMPAPGSPLFDGFDRPPVLDHDFACQPRSNARATIGMFE